MAISSADFNARALDLGLLLFDVDGVLTDGGIELDSRDRESKRFFVRDGAALIWARREGLEVGLLSGRPSPVTTSRAAELGIPIVVQGGPDKRPGFERILAEAGLEARQVGYMGDDVLDLPILSRAGLSAAPADAVTDVLERVDWVSDLPGGRGAVRQFIELVLRARGRWDAVIQEHLR